MTEPTELPQAENADPDGVQVALRAAHALWSSGEMAESLRWLRRAAESALDEGADERSLELAKAAAELRAQMSSRTSELPSMTSSSLEGPRSEGIVTATQYPASRPPRSLMGLSSATLERAKQRDSSAPPARSAFEEPKLPPTPPPLPASRAPALEANDEGPWALAREPVADPRTWAAEVQESEPLPRTSSVRPPPMPKSSYGPPPLPEQEQEDEELDHNPEFLTEAADIGGTTLTSFSDKLGDAAPHARAESGASPFAFDESVAAAFAPLERPSHVPPPRRERARESSMPFAAAEPPRVGASSDSDARAASGPPLSARVHHQAVRVALALDPRVPGQFILRALRERETPQSGERVALLVALEPGTPLV